MSSPGEAFVGPHIPPGGPRGRGPVVQVLAHDNKEVPVGAPLVRLGPRDLEMKVHQARAALATAASNLRTAAAGVPMTDESTGSQVALAEGTAAGAALGIDGVRRVIDERRSRLLARRAAVQAATADVAARQADFDRAGLDRGRMQELIGRELVSRQEFDHADSAFRMAGAALEAARRRLDGARAEVAQAEAELASQEVALAQAGQPRQAAEAGLGDAPSRPGGGTIRSAEAASAQAKMAGARAALQEAALNLEKATLLPPAPRRVTRRTVEGGQTVQPGQPLP